MCRSVTVVIEGALALDGSGLLIALLIRQLSTQDARADLPKVMDVFYIRSTGGRDLYPYLITYRPPALVAYPNVSQAQAQADQEQDGDSDIVVSRVEWPSERRINSYTDSSVSGMSEMTSSSCSGGDGGDGNGNKKAGHGF